MCTCDTGIGISKHTSMHNGLLKSVCAINSAIQLSNAGRIVINRRLDSLTGFITVTE